MKHLESILIVLIALQGVFMYFQERDIKLNRRLTEALYTELEYKYDPSDNAAKTLYDEGSWLTNMKKFVMGDSEYFYPGKTLAGRVDDLEESIRRSHANKKEN